MHVVQYKTIFRKSNLTSYFAKRMFHLFLWATKCIIECQAMSSLFGLRRKDLWRMVKHDIKEVATMPISAKHPRQNTLFCT